MTSENLPPPPTHLLEISEQLEVRICSTQFVYFACPYSQDTSKMGHLVSGLKCTWVRVPPEGDNLFFEK